MSPPLFTARLEDEEVQEQIDKGSLVPSDLAFMQRQRDPVVYLVNGVLCGTGISMMLRSAAKRGFIALSNPARLLVSPPVGLLGGAYVGHRYAERKAQKKFSSLQNPEGFKQAMEEIYRMQALKRGEEVLVTNWTYGFTITQHVATSKQKKAADSDEKTTSWNYGAESTLQGPSNSSRPAKTPSESSSSTAVPSPTRNDTSRDRWEEIRKERTVAEPTAWDRIRQTYERERLKTMSSNPDAPVEHSGRSRGADRSRWKEPPEGDGMNDQLTDQEKFDALLEAERRASSGNADDQVRWSTETTTSDRRW